ncbi:MAG: hypothetical protein AB1348_03085 [Nitrospirota bacterium]
MRKGITSYFLVAVLCIMCNTGIAPTIFPAAGADIKPRIAFLMFVPKNIEATALMDTIPTLLTMAVGRTGHFEILERKKIEKGIELEGFKISSIKMEDLFNVGSKLGLDFCVFGDVQKEGSTITANIKVLDIRVQKVCSEHALTTTEGGLHDKVKEVSPIIAGRICECFSAVFTKVAKKDERHIEPPYSLRATGGTKRIRIKWSHSNLQNIIGFKVYRARDKGGPYVLLGTVSDMTFVDENPALNEPLFYKVRAVNKNGIESEFSDAIEARTVAGPLPPIFLNIESDIKSAHLRWMARPGSEVSGFKVYRKEITEKEFKEITSVPGDITVYTDRGLKDDTTYHYVLTAIDSKGTESEISSILEAKTLKPPDGLKAEGGKIRKILLNWNVHSSSVVDGYRIYRAVDKMADYKPIAKIKDRITNNCLDTEGLNDSATYWYRISAYNKDGIETDMSDAVSATTRGIPPVPQGLTAKDREPRRASLKWDVIKSPDDEIKGYLIFRSTEEKGEYKKIAEITNHEENLFIDKYPSLRDDTTYYYKIASYNSAGVSSDLSSPISSTTKALPHVPRGLLANSREVKQVTLMWEPNLEKDIKLYNLYRAVSGDKDFEKIASVKSKTVYVDTGLKDGTEYSYTIEAVDEDGLISELSPPVTAVTKPLPMKPTGLRVSDKDGKKMVQWDPSPEKDVKQYNVYKKGFLGISQKIATVQSNSWVIDEVKKGKLEVFVTALDETGLESEGSELIVIEGKK